jgi:hypothetical protein
MLLRPSLCWFVLLLGLAANGWAVERFLVIEAPRSVKAGEACTVVLTAGTDAGQGEQVGLFQADFSTDGGRTWEGLCYLDKLGPETRQERHITAGAAGSEIRVRLRVAFRDGLAGDVDYRGAAIRWHAGWEKWQEPPAKSVSITVVSR